MKGKQKEYWENQIRQMNSENQFELASILTEQLSINEELLDEETNYDFRISQNLRAILDNYIEKFEPEEEKKQKTELLTRFFNLSIENQKKVIDDLLLKINAALKQEETEEQILLCKKNGHQFDDWIEEKYYNEEREFIDKILFNTFSYSSTKKSIHDWGVRENFIENYGKGTFIQECKSSLGKIYYTTLVDEINNTGKIYWFPYSTRWKKVCSNCKHEEYSYTCPQEIIDKENEKAKNERILQLEQELKTLKKS